MSSNLREVFFDFRVFCRLIQNRKKSNICIFALLIFESKLDKQLRFMQSTMTNVSSHNLKSIAFKMIFMFPRDPNG